MIKLVIPRITPSLNIYLRMPWRKRHKLLETWQTEVLVAMREYPEEIRFNHPKRRVKIVSYRKRFCDRDNFFGGLKPLIDGLRLNNLIVDDSNKFLELEPRPSQVIDSGNLRTEIFIEEVKE